jgi:hypothetical protein
MNQKYTQRSILTRSQPRMIHRVLIGIGVLALCFFITGKALQAFKGDDNVASTELSVDESQVSVEQTLVLISKDTDMFEKIRRFSDLEILFGDKVVFISASEPPYLMTDDERRFEVGDIPGTDIELSSISSTQLVLKQAEELMVLTVPGENTN